MGMVCIVSALDPVLFGAAPVLVTLGFLAALAAAVFGVLSGSAATPVLTVDCHVTGKRVLPDAHFVTFETANGSHVEFAVYDTEYSRLTEGDEGSLTFRGGQYLGFEPNR